MTDITLIATALEGIESLRLLHTHDDLQAQRINQLNQDIDIRLQSLDNGNKISAEDSNNRLKKKITKIAKATK